MIISAEIWAYLGKIFLAFFKFGFGLFAALMQKNTVEGLVINLLGGVLGIVFFIFFGQGVNEFIKYKLYQNKPKKLFTKRNRFLVKIRRNYGIYGISFLAPILITIPLGILINLNLTQSKVKIFWVMMASCVFWSLVFYGLKHLLDINF
ncbi:MAG: hypothetical protein MUE53_06925 [Chitinophagales bacterium]|jgi:hypothetical protein|nr:hypothetical protein [Chitinophagales bacterium]